MSVLDIFKPRTSHYTIEHYTHETPVKAYIDGMSAADFYRKQPHLQTVISFISSNVAQLPIKLYRKGENGDRQRITDNELSRVLSNPNANQSTYDLILQTMSEYKLYGEAFWFISYGKKALYEIHVIPNRDVIKKVRDGFGYSALEVAGGAKIPFEHIIHFHNYDPLSNGGLTPVECLKHILAEQVEAWGFRRKIWKNRGVFNEYIVRPKDVEPMTNATVERFRTNFSEAWNGRQGGKLPLLEDGMEIKSAQFNARELQWLESAQLSLDTVAAVYHIRSSLVGGSTAQSYASAKDNARALYSDALAPDLKMLSDKLNSRLIPMLGYDNSKYYFELDIQAKLEGSLSEQAQSLQTLVQGSIMKPSEARERLNLNYVDGSDNLLIPLNSTMSNLLEDVQVNSEKALPAQTKAHECTCTKDSIDDYTDDGVIDSEELSENLVGLQVALAGFFARQERSISSAWGAGNREFNRERWNRELAEVMQPYFYGMETENIERVLKGFPIEATYSQDLTHNFIEGMVRKRAEMLNDKTADRLAELEDVKETFKDKDSRAKWAGLTIAAALLGFMEVESCAQNEQALKDAGYRAYKTWLTTSRKPRPAHAATNGETVPVNEPFSLGGYYPGDARMPAELVINCMCILDKYFEKED